MILNWKKGILGHHARLELLPRAAPPPGELSPDVSRIDIRVIGGYADVQIRKSGGRAGATIDDLPKALWPTECHETFSYPDPESSDRAAMRRAEDWLDRLTTDYWLWEAAL